MLADWLFTTPAIIVQAATGIAPPHLLGYPIWHGWLLYAVALYCIAGLCWLPVVWLQIQMRDLALGAERYAVHLNEGRTGQRSTRMT